MAKENIETLEVNQTTNNREHSNSVLNPKDNSKINQIGILGVHVAHAALDLFVSVFLTAQLLFITGEDFSAVALFYIVLYTSLMICFWLFSYVVKRNSRVWCIRFSTFCLLVSIILIILMQNKLSEFYLLFALVYGIAEGIYWSSIHTFTSEALAGKKMAGYQVWYQVTNAATKIVFPFTIGAVIEFVSFEIAAMIAALIGAVLILFTLILRDQRKSADNKMSMRSFLKLIKQQKISKPLWSQFWVQFLYGFFGAATLCVTILITLVYKSNFSLGMYSSIFAAVSIVVITAYRLVKEPKVKRVLFYAACAMPLLSAIGLLFNVGSVTLFICQAGYTGFSVIPKSELEKARMNLMKDFDIEHMHTENLVFTELAYYIARIISMCLIIIVYLSYTFFLFQIMVAVLMSTVLFAGIALMIWNKKFLSSDLSQ